MLYIDALSFFFKLINMSHSLLDYVGQLSVSLQCTGFVFDSLIQDFKISTEISATDVQDQLQPPRCLSKERQLCGLIVLGVPVG